MFFFKSSNCKIKIYYKTKYFMFQTILWISTKFSIFLKRTKYRVTFGANIIFVALTVSKKFDSKNKWINRNMTFILYLQKFTALQEQSRNVIRKYIICVLSVYQSNLYILRDFMCFACK